MALISEYLSGTVPTLCKKNNLQNMWTGLFSYVTKSDSFWTNRLVQSAYCHYFSITPLVYLQLKRKWWRCFKRETCIAKARKWGVSEVPLYHFHFGFRTKETSWMRRETFSRNLNKSSCLLLKLPRLTWPGWLRHYGLFGGFLQTVDDDQRAIITTMVLLLLLAAVFYLKTCDFS